MCDTSEKLAYHRNGIVFLRDRFTLWFIPLLGRGYVKNFEGALLSTQARFIQFNVTDISLGISQIAPRASYRIQKNICRIFVS